MAVKSGTRLGPYEIVAPLGAGGMGEVYRALDTRIERTVAIKVLADQADPDLHARFEREARAIGALNHPHICTLHDIGTHDGRAYLVLELVEGETLAARLARGPLAPAQTLEYATQIAAALDKAHRAGIVHRDLKPGNVMLTKTGVKLLDFGLARRAAAAPVSGASMATDFAPLTARGVILGTLSYMAPEQLEGRDADARTDIFALGMLIYEMATGRRAFESRSEAGLVGAILRDDPPPLASVQPAAPPALERVVQTCLAKDPDDRFQSAHDVLIELKWAAAASPVSGPVATATTPRSRVLRLAAWSILPIVAAGAAAVGYAIAARQSEPLRIVRFHLSPPEGRHFGRGVALAPDSRHLVFAVQHQGSSQLWLRSMDAEAARPLAGTEDAIFPFWSPDSRSVGFFAHGALKRVSLAGGPPIIICEAGPSGRGGSWAPDGTIVFAANNISPLFRVAASGGQPVALTTLDTTRQEVSHRFPHFLPDGRQILFFGMTEDPSKGRVRLTSLDAPNRIVDVTPTGAAAEYVDGHLVFPSGSTLLAQRFDPDRGALAGDPIPVVERVSDAGILGRRAFSVAAGGLVFQRLSVPTSRLEWVSRAGQTLATIGDPARQSAPELSPDGTRVAVSRSEGGTNDIWIVDDRRGTALRLMTDQPADTLPVWSLDGRRLAIASARGTARNQNLYVISAEGGQLEPLVEGTALMNPLGWTRDGEFVWAQADSRTLLNVWRMSVGRDRKPEQILTGAHSLAQAQLSPDGRWIAYASNPTGRMEVYVRRYPDGTGLRQVSSGGGVQPRWRSDGREIFFLSLENRLMSSSATPGEQLEFGRPTSLFEVRVSTDAARSPRAQYAVSADGARFVVNRIVDQAVSELSVWLNWRPDGGR